MTWDDLEMLACGELGLKIPEFYLLTPRQFDNILEGYHKKKEAELKLDMTLNRDLKFAFLLPHISNKNATAQSMFPFPWEAPNSDLVDLQAEIEAVESNRSFWQRVDDQKKLNT